MKKKYENFLNQTLDIQMQVNATDFNSYFFKKRSNKLDTIPEDEELKIKQYEKESHPHDCEALYDNELIFVTTRNIYTYRLFIEDSRQIQNRVNKRDLKLAENNFLSFK